MAITAASVVAISAAITETISVIKLAVSLGEAIWPKISGLVSNLETLWDAYVNKTEITDERLSEIQAQTISMSEEINRLYKEKYGSDAV